MNNYLMSKKGKIMIGILFAFTAGLCITLQNGFNTNVSGKIGVWELTTLVHGVGFVGSLFLLFTVGGGGKGFINISQANPIYLLGGLFGVFIVFSITSSIHILGVAFATMIMLMVQLFLSVFMDTFGLFGLDKVPLSVNRILGLAIMIIGILIYKLK